MVGVTRVYGETGKLVEKYDVMSTGRSGGGGEYPLQDGFGWTNGVMRKLMALYPAEAADSHGEQCPQVAKGVQRFSAAVLARARWGCVEDCRPARGAWLAPSKPRLPRPISRQEAWNSSHTATANSSANSTPSTESAKVGTQSVKVARTRPASACSAR